MVAQESTTAQVQQPNEAIKMTMQPANESQNEQQVAEELRGGGCMNDICRCLMCCCIFETICACIGCDEVL
ncbi:uncharacterized protein L969DRAFT_96116 [Mixia osmundae IAM 14324]|uniref:Uncharacterized protein n=1 Tax=Mixia osmundae (strain CBS 9802 / IAM 14324 / JCM 22182 / KY 12970) TaxID=764103 RepID=G7EA28_MIXOS|nr:uncharacterized protein L969DRAFT_96116 [Mixia osmundae IAM 14324]KEI37588.1 hypothetical protein L969DRAFT_96116 [Mixia osmundae IAM 14324]GAA99688.1 hypothetical protein E5Q_06391 [Mixia osmundae IAM 14324]